MAITQTTEQQLVLKTKGMIDGLKSVCKDYGLANDSSEYKIITESFLYKFLNDKFRHELFSNNAFVGCNDVNQAEEQYSAMTEDQRKLLLLDFIDTARIQPNYLLSNLFNQQNESNFSDIFDSALVGIANDNIDTFSVKTGGGEKIRLFRGISNYIAEPEKRSAFCRALVNKMAAFSFEEAFGQKYDFFSQIFEYLISDYNKDSGEYGEYFTPNSVANIIARILVPEAGPKSVTVYDPACGSGTLVLAIAHQLGEQNCSIYGQDQSQKANEFMRLNLILNGLVHSLPNIVHDDTLAAPRHLNKNKNRLEQFDYVVSNPPFKSDFSSTRNELAGEKYKKRFFAGVPNIPAKDAKKMAIYLMFIQHILYCLKEQGGKAAIVVPTGFLTAKSKIEETIRRTMVEKGMLRGVVSMPSNIFANTGTNVSIVFLDVEKRGDSAIFIDASKLGTKVKLDGKNQKTVLSADEIDRIIDTFNVATQVDDFSVVVSHEEVKAKKYSFSAGQYFDVKIEYVDLTPEEFDAELARRMESLEALFAESNRLRVEIVEQMKKVRFE
jgi:type I restriction enzyme M protein